MEKEILYQKIYNDLSEAIQNGTYKKGSRLPSEKELSEQYGVSRITSRKALDMLMERNLVSRRPGKGTFVINTEVSASDGTADMLYSSERENKVPSKEIIGIVVDRMGPHFGGTLVGGIEYECARMHYHVILKCTHGDVEMETQALKELVEMGAKGIILMPVQGEVYNPEVLKLYIEKFPMVLVDREMPGIRIPCVSTDNYTAAKELVNLLIQKGHKKIAFVSHEQSKTSVIEGRFSGYLDGIFENQLETNESLWLKNLNGRLPALLDDERGVVSDTEGIKEFILSHPEVTGFFAINFSIGIMIYNVLKLLGMDKEKEVVFFDGMDAEYDICPMFSRIVQNEVLIGASAVKLLQEQLEGKVVPLKNYIPYTMVKRDV